MTTITIGTAQRTEIVPAYGWEGFLNIFRKLLGKPVVTFTRVHIKFDPPVEIAPGDSLKILELP
jgi:hypothetical protein